MRADCVAAVGALADNAEDCVKRFEPEVALANAEHGRCMQAAEADQAVCTRCAAVGRDRCSRACDNMVRIIDNCLELLSLKSDLTTAHIELCTLGVTSNGHSVECNRASKIEMDTCAQKKSATDRRACIDAAVTYYMHCDGLIHPSKTTEAKP